MLPEGTVRLSRAARRLAVFATIRYTQCFSDDLPSNVSMFWMTASHVSCTTSSADALLATYDAASRCIPPDQASNSIANVASSPLRKRATSTLSGGIGSSEDIDSSTYLRAVTLVSRMTRACHEW